MLKRLNMKYLDNNLYVISNKAAGLLTDKQLPKRGFEKKVSFAGYTFWLSRQVTQGKVVWALRHVCNDINFWLSYHKHTVLFNIIKSKGYIERS